MSFRFLFQKNRQQEGGKAAGLRDLQKAGCQVPPFMVLGANVFAKSIDHSARQIHPNWHSPDVEKMIDNWLRGLSANAYPLAVRSSAVGEDGQQHAYPGMLDTVLHVASRAALTEAIHTVAGSIWSERVLAYQREKGIVQMLLPAVIIQQEIAAEFSGVLFTTHPPYPNELMAHLIAGYGDELVAGNVDPTEVAFDQASGHLIDLGQDAPLPGMELLESLFRTGMQLEKAQNHPQDIEFCIANGVIWFVQMRPITTPTADQRVLDNSNIQESYCGATTELTYTFARNAYKSVYTQTMRALGLSANTVATNNEVVSHLLEKCHGNIYYNINNWYRGLQLLPAFRQNKADMERMMGLEEPVDFITSSSVPFREMITKLPKLILNMGRLLLAFRSLKKDTVIFQDEFKKVFEDFYASGPSEFTMVGCRKWYHELNKKLLQRWHVPIVNDFYVMMQNGKVHRQLRKSGMDHPETWLQNQLIGDGNLPSLAPVTELQKLGKSLGENQELVALILEFPPNLHEIISESFPAAFQSIQQYIHQYGDRTIGELKLETTTMRVAPAIFYKYLQNYLHSDVEVIAPETKKENSKSQILNLGKLREGIYRRETLRLERTRLFGMYRSLFLRVGALLKAENKIEILEDIFHLTLSEMKLVLAGENPPSTAEIDKRKAEYLSWQDLPIPTRVYIPGRNQKAKSGQLADGNWQGEPAVGGMAEGEVVCIKEPGEWNDLRGKIICALRTDPGWAPLFTGCRGVIIEKGSSLSHSVIMLRELGIPTIINLPGITQNLHTGSRVKMDANTGKIEIE